MPSPRPLNTWSNIDAICDDSDDEEQIKQKKIQESEDEILATNAAMPRPLSEVETKRQQGQAIALDPTLSEDDKKARLEKLAKEMTDAAAAMGVVLPGAGGSGAPTSLSEAQHNAAEAVREIEADESLSEEDRSARKHAAVREALLASANPAEKKLLLFNEELEAECKRKAAAGVPEEEIKAYAAREWAELEVRWHCGVSVAMHGSQSKVELERVHGKVRVPEQEADAPAAGGMEGQALAAEIAAATAAAETGDKPAKEKPRAPVPKGKYQKGFFEKTRAASSKRATGVMSDIGTWGLWGAVLAVLFGVASLLTSTAAHYRMSSVSI